MDRVRSDRREDKADRGGWAQSSEVPNRDYKPRDPWVPKLLNVACVPNGQKAVDSILGKQGCYAQPGQKVPRTITDAVPFL